MGRCYKCGKNTKQLCVGCPKRPAFVCTACELPCFWCNDNGPYCTKCLECQTLKNKCGEPGNHKCEGCNKRIFPKDPRAMCDICDEFYYHIRCMTKCDCGDSHYLCEFDSHCCEGNDLKREGYRCPTKVCKRGRMEGLLRDTELSVCVDHKRVVKQRVAELHEKWNV